MTANSKKTRESDSKKIRELAKLLDETNLSEIEIENNGTRIRVARQMTAAGSPVASTGAIAPAAPSAPPAAPTAEASSDGGEDLSNHPGAVTSPMVGTAYLAPEPGAAAFCKTGDTVSEGQTLFIVEAMKTMNPITAHKSGKISKICISDGQPVEFGEALAIID